MQPQTGEETYSGESEPARRAISVPGTLATPRAKLVYLYLAATGSGTASELCEALDMRRINLFPVLRTLASEGILRREEDGYRVTQSR